MATQETRSTPRSTAPSRTPAPASTPSPAPSRAAQARVARADVGGSPPKPAPAPAPPVADRVSTYEESGSSSAGSLLEGLNASFHPSGDWGQGYLGIQAQNGNASYQFSLDTPKTQINGAGEAQGFVGARADRDGLRLGAFGQATANGSLNDAQFDLNASAMAGLEASRSRVRLGAEAEGTLSVTQGDKRTDTTLGLSTGAGVKRDAQGVRAAVGTQLRAQRAVTSTNESGSSFAREGVVAVGPGATFEAGGTLQRDKVNGTTTLGAHLVIPTPFGVSLGGGGAMTLSDHDLAALPGPLGATLRYFAH